MIAGRELGMCTGLMRLVMSIIHIRRGDDGKEDMDSANGSL